jgi:methylmalonyl-CoA mutase C-terminal domain/subunit
MPSARNPASRISPPASKHGCPEPRRRGGRRPGAGAPKGNMNALKNGNHSKRVQALAIALHTVPLTADVISRIDAAGDGKRAQFARVLHHYADLLLLPTLGQSTDLAEITPGQIRQFLKIEKPIKQSTRPGSRVPRFPGSANPGPWPLALDPSSCHNLPAMTNERPIRVLIAKPGLDGHDRGAKVVARALRDAGMEVIYTGIRQTPEMIAEAALQEDVDVIGLSILSGAHLELFPRVVRALKDRGVDPNEVLLFAGGIIPDEDIPALKQLGFSEIYRPGASTQDIIAYVRRWAAERGLVAAAVEGGPASGP